MMTEKLNTGLIDAIRERMPDGANVANILMDLLYIGKEAVYRRLRGEVPFTLSEAAVISQKLGVSLDKLTGASFGGNALFDLNLLHYDNPVETYYSIIDDYAGIFGYAKDDPEAELNTSSNIIPQTIYLKYEQLSKFRMFKWLYQHTQSNYVQCYEELTLPAKLLERQRDFVAETQNIQKTCYIMDSLVFRYMVNDIRYFASAHLIPEEDLLLLKGELLELLDEMERVATAGRFDNGNEVKLYISNVNFEATYSYVESKLHNIGLIRVFAINSITSKDPEMFEQIKEWIQSQKKFSTLISHSGEMQRRQFFAQQRELIDSL